MNLTNVSKQQSRYATTLLAAALPPPPNLTRRATPLLQDFTMEEFMKLVAEREG